MSAEEVGGKDEREFMAEILDERWEESIPERPNDVPKPVIRQAGGADSDSTGGRRAENIADNDVIYTRDGGDPDMNPASIGFRDLHLEQVIDVEIRTAADQERMFGTEEDEYGGLAGEVQRIVDSVRFGLGPYEYIWYDTVTEASEDHGAGIWHVEWPVRFIAYSNTISQTGER